MILRILLTSIAMSMAGCIHTDVTFNMSGVCLDPMSFDRLEVATRIGKSNKDGCPNFDEQTR